MRPVASAFAFAVVLAAVALDYVVADDCMPEGWDPKVAIGDKAFLCLRFNNRTQAVFTPEVDQFTQLSITNCACAVVAPVLCCAWVPAVLRVRASRDAPSDAADLGVLWLLQPMDSCPRTRVTST